MCFVGSTLCCLSIYGHFKINHNYGAFKSIKICRFQFAHNEDLMANPFKTIQLWLPLRKKAKGRQGKGRGESEVRRAGGIAKVSIKDVRYLAKRIW